jgi:hypothetical protein
VPHGRSSFFARVRLAKDDNAGLVSKTAQLGTAPLANGEQRKANGRFLHIPS